jgi:hypothetical protein
VILTSVLSLTTLTPEFVVVAVLDITGILVTPPPDDTGAVLGAALPVAFMAVTGDNTVVVAFSGGKSVVVTLPRRSVVPMEGKVGSVMFSMGGPSIVTFTMGAISCILRPRVAVVAVGAIEVPAAVGCEDAPAAVGCEDAPAAVGAEAPGSKVVGCEDAPAVVGAGVGFESVTVTIGADDAFIDGSNGL